MYFRHEAQGRCHRRHSRRRRISQVIKTLYRTMYNNIMNVYNVLLFIFRI